MKRPSALRGTRSSPTLCRCRRDSAATQAKLSLVEGVISKILVPGCPLKGETSRQILAVHVNTDMQVFSQDLGDVVSNMNKLNKNLESMVEVGRDIERVSNVWLSFHGRVSCH